MDSKQQTPAARIKGLTFFPIPEFTDVELTFGAGQGHYFGKYDHPEIPHKYKGEASRLFFSGGAWPEFGADVPTEKAKRAIVALLKSFQPSHEAKEATVAYALWVWSPEAAEARAEAGAQQ